MSTLAWTPTVTDATTGKPILNAAITTVVVVLDSTPDRNPVPAVTDANGQFHYPFSIASLGLALTVEAPGYESYVAGIYRTIAPGDVTVSLTPLPPQPPPAPPAPVEPATPVPTVSSVAFDHDWTGQVELALRALLASGLAGDDGLNGEAVVQAMNAKGGIYAGGEFQPHHDGPSGMPTYGYPWFYVTYITDQGPACFYQIVEFGAPPAGN